MKKIPSLFIMLFSCCALFAQDRHAIDSLERALLTSTDTAKIRIYQQLTGLTSDESAQTGLQYAQQALTLATQLKRTDLKTEILTDIGSIYRNRSDYRKAITYFKEAIASQIDTKSKLLAETLFELGIAYLRITELDSSRTVLLKALEICQRTGDKRIEAGIYNCL